MNIKDLQINAYNLLKEIIAIPSFSGQEDKVADLIANYLKENEHNPFRKGNNVWVISKHFSDDKPCIMLDAHIDTVKPVDGWLSDPFTPIEEDEKLIGLGSNDTGGSVVSMLHAFLYLDQKPQAYNLIYVASAEEENTGSGGIKSIIADLPPIALGIIGEPTHMQMAIAEKGLFVLDCTAVGKSGHAARNIGINAIHKAIEDIEWFNTYSFPKESRQLGKVKMSVTQIEAGSQHNVIPGSCNFVVDIRTNEHYSNKEVAEIIAKNVKSEIKPRSFNLNSSMIATNHPLVEKGKEIGLTTFGSPTTSNQAVLDFTTIKMGPGDSSRSHTANEFIYKDEIYEGIEIFIELLEGLKL